MRVMKPSVWISPLLVLLSATTSHAASRYTENFNDGLAQSWSSSTTWSASANYYRNDSEDFAAIATYGSDTWTTNFSLTAQLYSEYGSPSGATGNKVGLVFGYVDDQHYFKLLINTKGLVELYRIAGSNETLIDDAVLVTPADVNAGKPYPVQVILAKDKATVRVSDETVFNNLTVTGLAAGRVGVISQYNHGRFDDINIANLLFKSGFDGVTFNAPSSCNQGTCFYGLSGTDAGTGFSWPLTLWDLTGEMQATSANSNANASNISQYVRDEIQQVTGPFGVTTNALYQGILEPRSGYSWYPQNPHYIYKSGASTFAQHDLYFRYWLKIGTASSLGTWRTLWQWKTVNDFRLNVNAATEGYGVDSGCNPKPDGSVYWHVYADNLANQGDPQDVYWERCNQVQPVPVGQWIKIEIYSQRGTPGGSNGRVWVAINGQTYIDVTGQQMWGVNSAKINRIMAPTMYTNAAANPATNTRVEQWTDDYEVWDGFPADASPH